MFFSETILSSKGPLAKVWLAAHMEKKLTKAQLLQADLKVSIVAIGGEGPLPMALRLSGQLLLGVVRIYSRKAKYLLDDCNEANIKLKMAFRPGVVDLPADQLVANLNAITLPDTVSEFALLIPDPDFNLRTTEQGGASQTVSHREDILLQESFGLNDGLLHDTAFEDFNAPEYDVTFDFLEQPMDGIEAGRDAGMQESPAISLEAARNLNITPKTNLTDEPFGAPDFTPRIDGFGAESVGSDFGLPPLPGMPQNLETEPHQIDGVDLNAIYHAKKPAQKRKLMVDNVLEIDPRQLKLQLDDTSDITLQEALAPASKRTMHYLDLQDSRMEDFIDLNGPANLLPELQALFTTTLEDEQPHAAVFEMPVDDLLGAFADLPHQMDGSHRDESVQGQSYLFDPTNIDVEETFLADHGTFQQTSPIFKLAQSTLRAVELIKTNLESHTNSRQNIRQTMASFNEIAGPETEATRIDAVRLFFEMLVLNTKDVIDVKQSEPYGDMKIQGKDKLFDEDAFKSKDS